MISILVVMYLAICGFCVVLGIARYRAHKRLAIMLLCIPVVLIGLPIGLFYYAYNSTTPDSLSLKLVQTSPTSYVLQGKWEERADFYSHRQDGLVFCFASKQDRIDIKLPQVSPDDDAIVDFGVQGVYQAESMSNRPCTAYRVELSKKLELPFEINLADSKEVDLYYVHLISEPMDSPTYWYKSLKLAANDQ